MDSDDLDLPKNKKAVIKNLDVMSVQALNDYILELENEISRVKQAIATKDAARNSAENAFK